MKIKIFNESHSHWGEIVLVTTYKKAMIVIGLSFDLRWLEMSFMKTMNANLLLHGFYR